MTIGNTIFACRHGLLADIVKRAVADPTHADPRAAVAEATYLYTGPLAMPRLLPLDAS